MALLGALAAVAVMAWPAAPATADTSISIAGGSTNCSGSSFCYNPSSASAAVGTAVTWTNSSAAQHTVTPCTAALCNGNGNGAGTGTDSTFVDSGFIAVSGTFSHTFTAAGTYNYVCTIHGYDIMHGTITVSAGSTTSTVPNTTTTSGSSSQSSVTTVASSTSGSSSGTATTSTTTPGSALAGTGRFITNSAIIGALCVGIGWYLIHGARQRRRGFRTY